MNISPTYWAGFFDGDGTVLIERNMRVKVSVTSTDRAILEDLKNQWGGYIAPRATYNVRAKPAWFWAISGTRTRAFLEAIYPDTRMKRERINLALKYLDLGRLTGTSTQRIAITTQRRDYFHQLKALNHRGV